ncbi:MAG: FRG domain-containing protein [Verrucomicrobia bacterium]|nr:FRG domain-containing protein [Verrucomicrobiota bacterium]
MMRAVKCGRGEGLNQMTEKSFLGIFSYFGYTEANRILQETENHDSNFLRRLSANKTSPVVKEHCSTFKEFQDRFINKNYALDTNIGLAFRGQASEAWPLESSLFRLWTKLKMADNCGTSMKLDRFMSRTQDLAKKHLNPNWQNLQPDDGYLMTVLQHYTRISPLLDWTLNVKYALYFAFANAPADKSENVTIYIADIGKVNKLALDTVNNEGRYNIKTILDLNLDAVKWAGIWAFFRPAHFGDIRFAIQEGVFAYQAAPIDLDEHLSKYNSKTGTNCAMPGTLWIVTLPVSERPAVMDDLVANHITGEKLFAGWDEIGRDIVSKYTDEIIKDLFGIPSATFEQIRG